MKLLHICCLFLLSFTFMGYSSFAESSEVSSVADSQAGLSFNEVVVTGKDSLKLVFGTDIDSEQELDFILSPNDTGEEIFITELSVEGKDVILSLESELESKAQYKIVVISVYGVDGSTISSGIDGALKFTTPDMTIFDPKVETGTEEKQEADSGDDDVVLEEGGDEEGIITANNEEIQDSTEILNNIMSGTPTGQNNNTNEANTDESEEIDLNSAGVEKSTEDTKEQGANLAGKELDSEEMDKNISVAASKTENLPTTGPEHIFFILLALIIGGLLFGLGKRKSSV